MRPRHLYVHVPFCARRCAYCDFSIAVRRVVPADEYLTALRAELALRCSAGEPWELDTLYFGGGTPSKLGPDGVRAAVEAIRGWATVAPGAEVTLEANPEDVTGEAVTAWREAGVNRLSLGVQSFDDSVLRWMHRTHDAGQARAAVETARDGGIGNLSLDLIFAVPPHVPRCWRADLDHAVSLQPEHVSLYGLTVESRTPLGRWVEGGAVSEASEERYAGEFLEAHQRLTSAGFEHYEVSNYSRPGATSRHNSSYWSGAAYLGLGPSAHAFDGDQRRWNTASYKDWAARLAEGRDPTDGAETLTAENRTTEQVYLGLRTTEGLALRSSERDTAERWVAEGWATIAAGRVRLTPAGWLFLDALALTLTAFRSR